MNLIRNTLKGIIYGDSPPDPQYLAGSIFRSISKMPEMQALIALWPEGSVPVERAEVVVYVAAHCLFMREVVRHYPRFDSPVFFNAMSDETKRLLAASRIRAVSPMDVFPDDEQRHVIVRLFLGPALVDSEETIITADRLFGMLLPFYMGHFITSFDSLRIDMISAISLAKTSEAMKLFILYASFGRIDGIPPILHAACLNLSARTIGSVKAVLDASPIR